MTKLLKKQQCQPRRGIAREAPSSISWPSSAGRRRPSSHHSDLPGLKILLRPLSTLAALKGCVTTYLCSMVRPQSLALMLKRVLESSDLWPPSKQIDCYQSFRPKNKRDPGQCNMALRYFVVTIQLLWSQASESESGLRLGSFAC